MNMTEFALIHVNAGNNRSAAGSLFAEADFVSGVRWQRHLIGRALVRRRAIEHYGGARH